VDTLRLCYNLQEGELPYVGTECWNPPEIISGMFARPMTILKYTL